MNKINCRIPIFWGVHARPGGFWGRLLGILPIVIVVAVYAYFSCERHKTNPNDKLMPSVVQMYQEVKTYVFVPDKRSGQIFFLADAKASLTRLGLGVSISAVFGFVMGILMGLYPGFRSLFNPIITTLSNVNPLAMLVIILVALGIGEPSKIFLIVFGIGIPLARSIEQAVEKIPPEMIVKQETLGASQLGIIFRVVVPQMFPRLIDLVRMSLGAAWIFVIAAEAIASTEGLGYRIYLQQRYMNMALIIPIVFFITTVAFLSDWILIQVLKLRRFKWYSSGN
jgi:NitT/TauT family transport system permease protein